MTKRNNLEKKNPIATKLIPRKSIQHRQSQFRKKKIGDVDKKDRQKWFSDYNCFEYKISQVENKISDISKYIDTQELNKLTTESFEVRLKEADLVNKTDFDTKTNKL